MRLAIADPPYLGRAALWYGGEGRSKQGTAGRARGRGRLDAEYHPDAARWDDPAEHIRLMVGLEDAYDGWVMAASGKTLAPLIGPAEELGARLGIWHVTNAIPDGARARNVWEAVFFRVPDGRRAVGSGHRVPDLLSAPHLTSGFVGSKPDRWTRWVLDLMGYQPGDEVDDMFPGSGAVARAMAVLL